MKRSSRRIRLQKETLRTLEAPSLRAVAGGEEDEHRTITTNACRPDDATIVCLAEG